MSIKDKIAILLTIFIVVIIGLVIRGNAAITGVANLDELAKMATNDKSSFLSKPVSDMVGKTIYQGNMKAVYYKSAMCMYHKQASLGGSNSNFTIGNVYDFSFENGFKLENNRKCG